MNLCVRYNLSKEEVSFMSLTPLDIHNKAFANKFRGYDEDEVNEFLDRIIKEYESVIRQKNELLEKSTKLEEQLEHFTNIEETLNKSILIAQETAQEVRGNAEKEARLIIKEADKNADRIVNESLTRARQIAIETDDMKKQAKIFRTRLKMLISAQMELIQTDDWDQVLNMDLETLALSEES